MGPVTIPPPASSWHESDSSNASLSVSASVRLLEVVDGRGHRASLIVEIVAPIVASAASASAAGRVLDGALDRPDAARELVEELLDRRRLDLLGGLRRLEPAEVVVERRRSRS